NEEEFFAMYMKKFIVGSVLAATTAMSPILQSAEMQFFRIGSGGTGGSWFPIAGLIANAISSPPGSRPCDKGGSCGVPGLVAIAQATNASVANVTAVQSGQIESGFTASDIAYTAYNGEGKFAKKGKFDKLRVIANFMSEELHLVLPKGSDIKSINDLKGKRVGIAQAGSGTQVAVLNFLKAFDIDRSNIDEAELNQSQSAEHIADGQLDAFFYVAPAPTAAMIQLDSSKGMELYRTSEEERQIYEKGNPFYYSTTIPAGTYPGVNYDVPTVGVGDQWVTSADVSEDLIYGITKALYNENSKKLFASGHPKAKDIKLEIALQSIKIPLHPGAERFYREQGLIK
ncbi:MAG: TAXI family TRAP transporter solute-binding subunit, partial [Chromatiales bacterium]|nr:TAXI family TRAP transporter solute-binding subunit [Chromatiales bacterium]